ncbi:MAG: GAF domain-containing protein [Acidimicrobiia bacterium]|nr:GAF domain-containing protein [Acidimicrobiia bacterium]
MERGTLSGPEWTWMSTTPERDCADAQEKIDKVNRNNRFIRSCNQYSLDRNFRLDPSCRASYPGRVIPVEPQSELMPSNPQLDFLHRISGIVSSERTIEEMLGELVGMTAQVTGCDACLVYLLDKDNGEIVLRASQVPHAKELGTLRLKIGEGVTGWVVEHKSVVALPANASADARFKRFNGLVEDTYEAFLSVPLVSGGDVIGVVNVHHREPHQHSSEEISLLTFIGEQMGNAVARANLAQENARLQEELETRKVVERAKGILQRSQSLSEEEAYLKLRGESRRMRRPMKELAEAIILADELNRERSF